MRHNKFKTNKLTTATSQTKAKNTTRVRVLQPARFGYTGANGNEAHQIQNKQVDNISLDQTKAEKDKTSKKGFLWDGSDGVDHVAREVLKHGVANRGSSRQDTVYSIHSMRQALATLDSYVFSSARQGEPGEGKGRKKNIEILKNMLEQ